MTAKIRRYTQALTLCLGCCFSYEASATNNASERTVLEQKLIQRGVPQTEAKQRVEKLSDEEVKKVNAANLGAGEDSTITIGIGTAILIAILLIVFL